MGDDEEKGEYDTPINKARPVINKRDLEDDSTRIRKAPKKREESS